MSFPQAERIALAALIDLGATASPAFGSGSETPENLQDVLSGGSGFVRVVRGPGPCDGLDDAPTIRVDAFGLTLAACEDLAEVVRTRLMDSDLVNEHGCIDRMTCPSGPTELPWSNPDVKRLQAIYQALVRRIN